MNNYDYYGIFVHQKDRESLRRCANIPDGWKKYCDHCTLIHHSCKDQTIVPFLDLFIGNFVSFRVIAIGRSEYAIAYMVDLPSMNKTAHITVAVAPGHKPVESNDIVDWNYRDIPDKIFYGHLGVKYLANAYDKGTEDSTR